MDDNGPWRFWGADSILYASITMSWVALNMAKKVIVIDIDIRLFEGSVKEVTTKDNIIINWAKSSQPLRCPKFWKKGILKLSTIGDHKYLNAYAKPAQLKSVTVLLSIPAFTSQTDKVENIKSIGNPDEKPRNSIFIILRSKNMDKFLFCKLAPPERW